MLTGLVGSLLRRGAVIEGRKERVVRMSQQRGHESGRIVRGNYYLRYVCKKKVFFLVSFLVFSSLLPSLFRMWRYP